MIRGLKRANKSLRIQSKRRIHAAFFSQKTVRQAPFAERINYMSVIMEWLNIFTFK
ncbi:hypothetical protein SF123566_8856 [Shigella flexneri 1235-66]|nr:hypothetical protein SF123566_8856 [Shigella flexneri 1235-66]